MRLLAACGALLVVGVGVWAGLRASADAEAVSHLPLPPPGEVAAALLDDGAPVFVVRRPDRSVHVVSAISPHLDILIAWCGRARVFLEPGPWAIWDERGRYLGGPAPEGLTTYATAIAGDGTVRVGDRRPAVGRDEPPLRPSGPYCDEDEVDDPTVDSAEVLHFDVEAHYGAPRAPERAPADGVMRRYAARLDLADEGARVCSPRPEPGCPADAPALLSAFHDGGYLDPQRCRGQVDGELLAQRTESGFTDAAMAPVPFPDCAWKEEEVVARVRGKLAAVERTPAGWVAVLGDVALEGVDGAPPPPGLAGHGARVRWPLAPDAVIRRELLDVPEVAPGAQLPRTQLRPEHLDDLLAEHGPQPVDLHLRADGAVVGGLAGPLALPRP